MQAPPLEALRVELLALKNIIETHRNLTVRDETILERVRTLFRSWVTVVKPHIEPLLRSKREFYKLDAELVQLVNLSTKFRGVDRYKARLRTALALANELVIFIPLGNELHRHGLPYALFIPEIPDLPMSFVPDALIGSMNRMKSFVATNPYDKSVFLMIRYRRRNDSLLHMIKDTLRQHGLRGILAREENLTDDLYNPIACLLCCGKGMAIFDRPETGQVHNPNVAYELGMLHLLGRKCLILKHKSLRTLHTDILMKLYEPYGTGRDAKSKIEEWISSFSAPD